jgi:hypothetical protein
MSVGPCHLERVIEELGRCSSVRLRGQFFAKPGNSGHHERPTLPNPARGLGCFRPAHDRRLRTFASPIESETSANITDRSIADGNASALRARTLPEFSRDVQAEGFGFTQREPLRFGQLFHRFEGVRARVERKRALVFGGPRRRPHDIHLAANTRDWSGPFRHDRPCISFSTLLAQSRTKSRLVQSLKS